MEIMLAGFLLLIVVALFMIKKPFSYMLSAENLADDLLGLSNPHNKTDNTNHVEKVITNISDSMNQL